MVFFRLFDTFNISTSSLSTVDKQQHTGTGKYLLCNIGGLPVVRFLYRFVGNMFMLHSQHKSNNYQNNFMAYSKSLDFHI